MRTPLVFIGQEKDSVLGHKFGEIVYALQVRESLCTCTSGSYDYDFGERLPFVSCIECCERCGRRNIAPVRDNVQWHRSHDYVLRADWVMADAMMQQLLRDANVKRA